MRPEFPFTPRLLSEYFGENSFSDRKAHVIQMNYGSFKLDLYTEDKITKVYYFSSEVDAENYVVGRDV
jgi:hypothetical protein